MASLKFVVKLQAKCSPEPICGCYNIPFPDSFHHLVKIIIAVKSLSHTFQGVEISSLVIWINVILCYYRAVRFDRSLLGIWQNTQLKLDIENSVCRMYRNFKKRSENLPYMRYVGNGDTEMVTTLILYNSPSLNPNTSDSELTIFTDLSFDDDTSRNPVAEAQTMGIICYSSPSFITIIIEQIQVIHFLLKISWFCILISIVMVFSLVQDFVSRLEGSSSFLSPLPALKFSSSLSLLEQLLKAEVGYVTSLLKTLHELTIPHRMNARIFKTFQSLPLYCLGCQVRGGWADS